MVEDLRIYLLGEFRVYRKGVLVSSKDWYTRQARQLFKLLLTEQGRTVSVEKLADLLWPEYSQTAHKTLRSAVNALRAVLEPERIPHTPSQFVLSGQAGYRLLFPPEKACWIDVVEFKKQLEQALTQENSPYNRNLLVNALQLYTGDYLAEDQTESWAMPERERLRERYLSAASKLVEWQQAAGLYDEAITVSRKALSFDPCREPLYRAIMESQASLGDTVAALQTFERCRHILDEHLGADPSPQTLELHAAILRGEFKPRPTTEKKSTPTDPELDVNTDVPFIGRKNELALLKRFLAESKKNRINTVALIGEAGVGKSFLVQRFLGRVQSENILTLSTACQAIEQGVSFAPLVSMLVAWLRVASQAEIDRLPRSILAQVAPLLPQLINRVPSLPIPPPVNSEQAYSRLVTGLVDLFAALCHSPLVLGWDDVQWADESTLLVINRLARLERLPLLMLISYRAEDLSENKPLNAMLRYLGRDKCFHTLNLERFSSEEVAQYLVSQKADPPLSAAELYQTTQGNALFLAEAVRTLLEDANTTPKETALLKSQQIRDVILARVARLSDLAANLLEAAAVIGRPFTLDVLRPVLSDAEYEALEVLLNRRFLVEFKNTNDREVRLTFSHEMVRQVVYAECSPLKLMQWHRQVAENMVKRYASASGMHAAEIAAHYRHAGSRFDVQVLRYEVEAGDYARRSFSYRQALSHYNTAVEMYIVLADKDVAQQWVGKAYQGRGLACEALLDWDGVKESYRQLSDWAIAMKDWDLASSSAKRVAIVRSLMGQLVEAADINLSSNLNGSSKMQDSAVSDMVQRWTSLQLSPFVGDEYAALNSGEEEGLPPFRPQPPPSSQAWVEMLERLGASQAALMLFQYGWALMLQGLTYDAENCLKAALKAAEETDQAACWVLSAMLLSRIYGLYGNLEEATSWFERCIDLSKQAPEAAWAATWPRIGQAYQLFGLGQLNKAEAILRTTESQLAQREDFLSYRYAVQIGFGLIELARGNLDYAENLFETALSNQAGLYIEAYILAEIALANIARTRKHFSEAFARLRRMLAFCGQRGLLQFYSSVAINIAQLCLDEGYSCTQSSYIISVLEKVQELSAAAGHSDIYKNSRHLLNQLRAKASLAGDDLTSPLLLHPSSF